MLKTAAKTSIKSLFALALILFSFYACADKAPDDFGPIRDFIFEKSQNIKPGEAELEFNTATNALRLNGVDIPIAVSTFRYTAIKGVDVVAIQCDKCIRYEKDGEEKAISGLTIPFDSKYECEQLIEMLEDLKATLQNE